MNAPFARTKLERFGKLLTEYRSREAKYQQSQRGWYDDNGVRQGGLIAFVRYFWHVLEPETPFVDGWPLWAMCEHLEAVTFGEITRLLITVPPGFAKSILVDVFWPAWEWGPMGKAHYRYVAFSYSASLTERDNGRFRDLITDPGYQKMYGPLKTSIEAGTTRPDGVNVRNKTVLKVMNTAKGWKLASSVGGVGTGERGDRVLCDDLHNIKEAESETIRDETTRWFRESVSSRFNNLATGALVVVMQRVNEADVAGVILSLGLDYVHLMIPWWFDPSRQLDADGEPIMTSIGWCDPRSFEEDPETIPAWPERFTPESMERLRAEIGPFAWAGQFQQAPAPRGGGYFQRSWWQLWAPEDGKFPIFSYLIASLDGAYTEEEENDPSALTVWGIFEQAGRRGIMLVDAWRKRLAFSAPRVERLPNEILLPGMPRQEAERRRSIYRGRTSKDWGLMEWVDDTCNRRKVDLLLIEAKASGISAAQELQNRFGLQDFAVQLVPVRGDKVARALAVQPTFSQLMVYAPDREWAEMVIEEMSVFPKGRFDDLTDSATQAMRYLRDVGLARTDMEINAEERERVMHRPRTKALYPV